MYPSKTDEESLLETVRSGEWIITYHEHAPPGCDQQVQPGQGCPNPATVTIIGFDCQQISDGNFACSHIHTEKARALEKSDLGSIELHKLGEIGFPKLFGVYAWMINESMMAIRNRTYADTARNVIPEEQVPNGTKDAVLEAFERMIGKNEKVRKGLREIKPKP